MKRIAASLAALLLGCACADPLPDPLTLEQALALGQAHPLLELARAEVQRAEAGLAEVQSRNGAQLSLVGNLAYLEPAKYSLFQSHDDNRVSLLLSKTLYDFGYTQAGEAAAGKLLEGRRWLEQDVRQNRQIEVMAAYFNVLLADLEYTRDNEAMAIAFIRMDKAKDRHELKQLSDIDLLEQESQYQTILQKRTASGARQMSARYQLAAAMNLPNELPRELEMPALPTAEMPKVEMADLVAEVQQSNPQNQWLRLALESAQNAQTEAGRRYGPVLRGEVTASEYARETGSTDPFRAALVLEIPLYTGGRQDAQSAKAAADVQEKRALLAQSELKTRQQVVDLWVELESLRARIKEMEAQERHRDLYLDRSRSLYEMEVTSDLGDAMVKTSEVALEKARAQFQWQLALARLNALRGTLLAGEAR